VKFVHAADVHLDSPLRGLERYPGAPHERMRAATRRAFENLVSLCLREKAAFLLLAGDTYDREWRDYNTGLFFASELLRLREAGTRVVMLRGNHDAKNVITKHLRLPEHVHELASARPETVRIGDVAIHGQSFPEGKVQSDLSKAYPEPEAGMLNVGMLHTSLDGREGHEPYAPCTVRGLSSKGYDYWALGHVHAREVVAQGSPWIVYPGNLQGRHARETGGKGASLVTVEGGRIASVVHQDLDVLRWSVLEVDIAGAESPADVVDRLRPMFRELRAELPDHLHAVRLVVRGQGPAHGRIAVEGDAFVGEVRGAANEAGDVWVEKVRVESRGEVDMGALEEREDAAGHLLRYLRGTGDSSVAKDFATELDAFEGQLPKELRGMLRRDRLRDEVKELLALRLSLLGNGAGGDEP